MRRTTLAAGLSAAIAWSAWTTGMCESKLRAVTVAFLPTEHVVGEEPDWGTGGIVGSTFFHYHVRDSGGVGLEYSQRLNRWFGYTASVSSATLTFERHERTRVIDQTTGAILSETTLDATDRTRFTPLLFGAELHMLPPGRCDLFMGPSFGYSYYDTLYGGKVDNHFVTALSLALDVDLTRTLAFSAAVRYIDAEAEPRPRAYPVPLRSHGETSVDPVLIEFGLAYRFGGRASAGRRRAPR